MSYIRRLVRVSSFPLQRCYRRILQPQQTGLPDTRVCQRFCNILVTWSTVRRFHMRLKRSWSWQTRQDCEMSSSPDTCRICLYNLDYIAWRSTLLGLPEFTWSSRFLQPEFSNPLVTVFWSTAPSLFTQKNVLFCFSCVMSHFEHIKYMFPIFMFICVKWSNAQRVSAQTITILPTTASTYYS